jgi:hypothetical protein
MGGRHSTTNTVLQDSVSKIMMNILVSHNQNCSTKSSIVQGISASTGKGGSVVITNNTLDLDIQSKLTCLMSSQLSQDDIANLQSQLQSDISNSSIKFPNVDSQATNNSLVQKFAQYASSNIKLDSVLNTAQTANIKQNITAKGDDDSSIIIDGNSMKTGLQIFQDTCTESAVTALQKFASDTVASGKASTEEVNVLQPLADTLSNLGKDASNVFSNISITMIIGFVAVVIVFILFGKDIMKAASQFISPVGW